MSINIGLWKIGVARVVVLLCVAAFCGLSWSASASAAQGVVGSLGSPGSGDGQFGDPLGVAVRQLSGDVYVVDSSNNRVEVFQADGAYVSQFGKEGSSAGDLNAPQGIAVEQVTGNVYVTDQGNRRVDEFEGNGNFVRAFGWGVANGEAKLEACTSSCEEGQAGSGAGEFGATIGYPAVDPVSGDVYVADPENARIERFHADGTLVSTFGGAGSGAGQFGPGSPTQLAVDGEGNVYATDPGNLRVEEFNAANTSASIFASAYLSGFSPVQALAVEPTSGNVSAVGIPIQTSQTELLELTPTNNLLEVAGNGDGLPAATGLAIGNTVGDTYYSSAQCGCVLVFNSTPLPLPSATIEPVGPTTTHTAGLHGTVDPTESSSNTLPTIYRLQYSTDEVSWPTASTGGEGTLPAGETAVPLSAVAEGLQPNTLYHVRVQAERPYGAGTATSAVETFTTPTAKPTLFAETFSEVTPTGATISVPIEAEGLETTYLVKYGPTSAYGSETTSTVLGSGTGSVTASVRLTGLSSNTEYHFQVFATNADGTSEGQGMTFKTQPVGVPALPDGRVYEKVSSNDTQEKNVDFPGTSSKLDGQGFDGLKSRLPFQVSKSGEAVTYIAEPTSPGGTGFGGLGGGNQYLATLATGGTWAQANLDPPGYQATTFQAFTNELTTGYLTASSEGQEGGRTFLPPLVPGIPLELDMLYARPLNEDVYRPFFTTTPPNRIAEFAAAEVTSDNFFRSEPAYAGSSADGSKLLFEGNDALTENAEAGNGSVNNLYESVDGQLKLVNELPGGGSKANATFGGAASGRGPNFSHVISEDGSKVFWTDLNTGDIYVRENATKTVPVSAGQARYWTATPDGRFAFYTEGGALDRFTVEGETRTELEPLGSETQGVIAVSNDGEYVYFIADAPLDEHGTSGAPNLYLWHAGSTSYIATLSSEDLERMQPFGHPVGDLQPELGARTAEATPDGRELIFMSRESLTGYDNVTPLYNGELRPVPEVYFYEAESGKLICASCDRSGEIPPSSLEISQSEAAAFLPVSWSDTYMPQLISDDGSRAFFDSDVPLVPRDTNQTQDVYEWERDGTGSCEESEGCIYLLSDGTNASASWLVGSNSTGRDVFFVSRAKLTPADGAETDVLYDARVSGERPPVPPQCAGTGCQGVPATPTVFATPASVTFEGVGNFPSPSSVQPEEKPTGTKTLTRAHKLSAALAACSKRPKKKRATCRSQAKKRYGATKADKKVNKTTKGRK